MASIRKIKNKWEARVRIKGHSTYCKSFSQKSDALSWSKTVEVGLQNGITPLTRLNKTLHFTEAVERYLQEASPSKKGYRSEAYRLRRLQASSLASSYLADIKTTDIKLFRDKRLSEVSTGSVRKELYLISSIFELARKEWGLEALPNPVRTIRLPQDSTPRTQRLSKKERLRLLLSLRQHTNNTLENIVIMALETAMRRSEICNLRWKNVDLKNSFLKVEDAKNGEARYIPLTQTAMNVLKGISKESELVFEVTNNAIRLSWEKFRRKFEFDYLRFHDLCHEAISSFFEMGLTVPEIASISGHKTPSQLFRYAHTDTLLLAKKLSDDLS